MNIGLPIDLIGSRLVLGELAARHLKPQCAHNPRNGAFYTQYGYIPEVDVLAALDGNSDMFQLWMMQFTLRLSEN